MQNLVINRPIRSSRISQRFGENKACIYPNGRTVSATACPVGSEPLYKSVGMLGHNGYDMPAIHGESIVHGGMYDGWMKTERDNMGGIGVDVVSREPVKLRDGTESYVKIRYHHLLTAVGYDGKPVKYGQLVGLADNTGASSGDHVHWALKLCDKDGNTLNSNNGYAGAIDQSPYYNHTIFAGDSVQYGLAPKLMPTAQERKEMISQLSIARMCFLELREFVYRHL